MLFNSYEFIFAFLPIVLVGYFLLNKLGQSTLSKLWLVLASLFFYSWWNIVYLPLLLFSLVFNYTIGYLLTKNKKSPNRKLLLIFGVAINVGLLAYFKYADFFIGNVNWTFHANLALLNLTLPLAISFFTFQQIAYVVDSYKGETAEYNFLNYALFVTFFPQLIAGPIVHHQEMMPQFKVKETNRMSIRNISLGLFIFFIGLFKKAVIADTFATWATAGFDKTETLTFFEGWIASLSYTFQLYFDFSGYTDMAIGAALLFNIKLPINFNSPYKALNINDFWRRWHITLTRFLTQYIYIPLGGNRKGNVRTYVNILIVFIISGLWHGAGWTFVFWGFLHGAAAVINRYWSTFNIKMNAILAWFITFNFVNIAWVFFRAKTWADAIKVLEGMVGLNGFALPSRITITLEQIFNIDLEISGQFYLDGLTITLVAVISILIALYMVVFTKNSLDRAAEFKPTWSTAFFSAAVTVTGILALKKVSEFLYFNF